MKGAAALRTLALAALLAVVAACGTVRPPATGAATPSPSPAVSSSPSASPSPSPAAVPNPSPSPTPSLGPAAGAHRIVVSLGQQHLWAYAGEALIVDTVVATGRPELPTVTGTFRILAKYSPYEFVSPWPPGSPYWYASAWSSYAMEFEASGYFIHDAPWRSVWGPGANLTAGSHGCINVPLEPMRRLYAWARLGDTVVVQR